MAQGFKTNMSNFRTSQDGAQHDHDTTGPIYTVADVAGFLDLKPQPNGKFCGAPNGSGKTKDGFILCPEGNAFTNDGTKYTSREVAELAKIDPGQYAPIVEFRARNTSPTSTSRNTPKSPANRATAPKSGAPKAKAPGGKRFDWEAAKKYDYTDETGALVFQVGRVDSDEIDLETGKPKKDFRQRRPDGRGGWVYSLGDVERMLYRLPDVLGADVVFFCEGEKPADAVNRELEAAGLFGEYVATTTSQGAGNSHKTDLSPLEAKTVCALPDNDDPGAKCALSVLETCRATAGAVKLVELPGLPAKGDADDFFAAGGDVETLLAIFQNSPAWKPPTPAPRFHLLNIPELFQRPDPEFLIEQWLIVGSTILFTAKHESFKTFVAIDMAACIASGKPYHGFRINRPGTVVYIAAEGAAGIKRRLQAWLAHHDETILPDRFFVLDIPLQIANANDRHAFIEQVKSLAPSLIVLDTLTRCAVGLDENSASDMGQISNALGEVARETGAACMIIHHNNKNGEYRGSTALPGNVDTHLSCERREELLTLKLEKQKDFEKHKPIVFETQTVIIPDTQGQAHSLVLRRLETRDLGANTLNDIEQKVFDAFCEVYGPETCTSSQWKQAAEEQKNVPKSTFQKARRALVDKGAVGLVSGKEGGLGKQAAIYRIAENWLPNNLRSTVSEQSTETVDRSGQGERSMVYTPLGVETVDRRPETKTETETETGETALSGQKTKGAKKPKRKAKPAESEPCQATGESEAPQ